MVATIIFDVDQYGNNGKKQQDMNKITHCMDDDQPQQPQHAEYDSNRPQHLSPPPDCSFPLSAMALPSRPALIIGQR
jgi:hypothetical protein